MTTTTDLPDGRSWRAWCQDNFTVLVLLCLVLVIWLMHGRLPNAGKFSMMLLRCSDICFLGGG